MLNLTANREAQHNLKDNLESITAFSQAMEVLDPQHIKPPAEIGRIQRTAQNIAQLVVGAHTAIAHTYRDARFHEAVAALEVGELTQSQINTLIKNGMGNQIHIRMIDNWSR